ncbi:FixG Ig-like domain-containing protein, partial [Vibrio vulnificus]|uniref:FixG Ig-like domain-containing protein n=1 Tax=Vibrio vulnificus TaxID=672 RepID=UPI0039B42EAB
DLSIKVVLQNGEGNIQMAGKPVIDIKKEGQASGTFFIILPKSAVKERKTILKLVLYSNAEELATAKTNFLGPAL